MITALVVWVAVSAIVTPIIGACIAYGMSPTENT